MSLLVSLALTGSAFAAGSAQVETVLGARTSPQLTAQGSAELADTGADGLAAVRADAESPAFEGLWAGGALELWSYLPDPDVSLVRAEPRVGWQPDLGPGWRAELGGRYALEAYPWSPDLSSGRAELVGRVGPSFGATSLGLESTYVRRDFFQTTPWSFQEARAGLVLATAPPTARLRAQLGIGAQLNYGFTVDASGSSSPASGSQIRAVAVVGWARRAVDLTTGWRLIVAKEGNVEDAARPQFTPIGQYADDADALSAGGFVQHRFDLSAIWTPTARWVVGLDGLLRLRTSDNGQASASIATTAHLQGRIERALSDSLVLTGTAGLTRAALVNGTTAADLYGWAGLRWQASKTPTGP